MKAIARINKWVRHSVLTFATLALALVPNACRAQNPVPAGVGLLICEPQYSGSDETLANFGAGAARWLHLMVAGHSEFGRTPRWDSVERVRAELKRPNVRFSLADARKLRNMLGITHAAIGTISSQGTKCHLEYTVYALASGKQIGNPIIVDGTRDQLAVALPNAGRSISQAVGLSSPGLPAAVGLSANELVTIGSLRWAFHGGPSEAQNRILRECAGRSPLGTVMEAISRANALTPSDQSNYAQTLMRQLPENALVAGIVGFGLAKASAQYRTQFEALSRKYPSNYLIASAVMMGYFTENNFNEARKAAERAVKLAPENPDAWMSLGTRYSDQAQSVRKSRFYSKMSQQEAATVEQLYPKWLSSVQHATQIDPLYGRAWERLAKAATFAGRTDLADAALWKAMALTNQDPQVIAWGLQMYQPKWGGDPRMLAKVANIAAYKTYRSASETYAAMNNLRDARFPELAGKLGKPLEQQGRAILIRRPNDFTANYWIAIGLREQGKLAESIALFQQLEVRDPTTVNIHRDISLAYYKAKRWDDSARESREALRIQPDMTAIHIDIASALLMNNNLNEAESEFRTAMRVRPDEGDAHMGLGEIYYRRNRTEEALKEFKEAQRLSPGLRGLYHRFCKTYVRMNRLNEAITYGQYGVQLDSDRADAHAELAAAYLAKKMIDESAAEGRAAIKRDPQHALAHKNLGIALNAKGQRAAARAEWEVAAKYDQGEIAKEAKEMLRKYPPKQP